MKNKHMYVDATTGSQYNILDTTGRFPLLANSVQISLEDLVNYINVKDGGNAYPGMLIAVDDDMTQSNVNVKSRDERGIYYITKDDKNNFTYYKLAYKNELNGAVDNLNELVEQLKTEINANITQLQTDLTNTIDEKLDPIIVFLNKLNEDNCPWEEINANEGYGINENHKIAMLDINNKYMNNSKIYLVEPIISNS